ncbi:MAG TPA: hypothetical protein VFS37_11550, partial [Conexibacter sp.]|nr:hypothetical protein [Conexibacter sp.]
MPAARALGALAAHQHRTAAGLLALPVLVCLWPVLVGGGLLAPTANLFIVPPFSALATPADLARFQPELADVVGTYYPWATLARDLLHSGTFPAWNPYAFAGTPLFANPQLAWLSPFSLPLWILPLNYGLGVAAALKLWVAGFGAYLFCRELRLGFWPAMLAGVGFTFCTFNVVWLTFGIFVSVAALLPWAMWLTERIVRRGRALDALALVGVVAVIQSGGHPGTQVHVLLAVVLYALLRAAAVAGRNRAERLRALGLVGGAIALGTLILAVVLLPAQEAAEGTFGAALRRNGAPTLSDTQISPRALRTALFPEWWGRPSEHFEARVFKFREGTLYAGTVALILAALALVSPGRWRVKAPLALIGALGPLVLVRAPLIYSAVIHLPLLNAVQPQRIILLFEFAVVVLAAFGLQAAFDARRSRRWPLVAALALLAGLVAVAAAAAAGGSATVSGVARQMLRRADAGVEPVSSATLALASVGWWLLLAVAVGAVLMLARSRPRWSGPAAAAIVLLLAFDLLHYAHGWNPMGPASETIPRPTGAVRYMRSHAGQDRIVGLGITLQTDWPTMYRLADVRGRDAPQPSLEFARLWLALDSLEVATVRRFDAASVNVLGLLGARWLLTAPDFEPAGLAQRDIRLAYSGADAAVYENTRAVPRAFVPARMRVVRAEVPALRAIFERRFDPRRVAVVRRDELGDVPVPARGAGVARVVRTEN